VIVGEEKKEDVIKEIHGGTAGGGHFGQNITIKKVTEHFWRKAVSDDVREYFKKCQKCQMSNPLNKADVAELHPIPVSSALFSR